MTENRKFLSGNEAIAHGAYRAGCKVAAAYPGTPSTEILENVAEFKASICCEWSVNEKVAMEVAIGASLAGTRALTAMKHVGLNVAADPLMTFSYIGASGGMVVVSADDPGMHSSQNEQDNRFYSKFAKIPLLEPSDSQEAYEMTVAAFEISEQFNTPVMARWKRRKPGEDRREGLFPDDTRGGDGLSGEFRTIGGSALRRFAGEDRCCSDKQADHYTG